MAAERFVITGDLAAPTFLPWVAGHARRLGLQGTLVSATGDRVEVDIAGPPDLIDAMELGVSLGPIEAWVEAIERVLLNRA